MDNPNCRNCGEVNTHNFCSNCGEQQYKRITMKDVVSDFLSNLVTLEGPILNTLKDLTIRPGKMINDYLNGKRKGYYKPFQYYILAITTYFIFFYLWDEQMLAMLSDIGATANTYGAAEDIKTMQDEMNKFQSDNMKFFTFLQIPLYAWLIWLFFRKNSGHSYTEALVSSLYILAQALFFGIVFTFCELIWSGSSLILAAIFMVVYLPWVLNQLYNETVAKTIFKSIAVILLNFILFGFLMAIVSFIWFSFFR